MVELWYNNPKEDQIMFHWLEILFFGVAALFACFVIADAVTLGEDWEDQEDDE